MSGNHRKKLLWVSFLFLDIDLHKTSRIEILRNLGKQGYEVTLLGAYSKTKPSSKELGICVVSIPVRKIPVISYFFLGIVHIILLPVLILKLKPDFIIADSADAGIFSGLISIRVIPRPVRPKVVVDVRSTPVETKGLRGFLETLCFRITILVARDLLDGITAVTSMMKYEISTKFHVDPKYVGVWSGGVSTKMFSPDVQRAKEAKELRTQLGLDDKFVILYHGALTANRGITEAIASISLLKGKYRNVVLLIVGRGPALPALKAASQKEISEGRVLFHLPVEYQKVPQYISACDVGLVPLPDIPDWRYQCALNLLECLATGKVVVATDIPANREVADESKAVVYAEPNAEGIAKAVMYAFDNRDRLAEWGAFGRELIEEEYEWKIIARKLDRYLSRRR
jgi:glycosyltransferase involved in cell wall biosynthesis